MPDNPMVPAPERLCEHRCIKDDEHVERGEPHFYGYALAYESLSRVTLNVCHACLKGAGGECHTPGCAFWMSAAPDVPLRVGE